MLLRLIGKCKSQSRKRHKEIFKIWVQGILATHLATHSWVSWVVKNANFSKLFTFPCITCLSLCLLHLSLSQNRFLYSKNLNFSLQFSLQIQEKVWVFTPFYFISSLKHYISWICCFCWDIEILLMNMGFFVFDEIDICVLLRIMLYCLFFMFPSRLLHAHALYNVLCRGVHTILLIKCLFRCFCV